MALTRASALFYWSARYGPLPIVGGRPTFTRSGLGSIEDNSSYLSNYPVNTPRLGWDVIDGERRQTLLLERAGSNVCTYSEDFSQWAPASVSRTTGQPDPSGATQGTLITNTGSGGFVYRASTFTGNATKVVSLYLKSATAAQSMIGLLDNTVSTWRHSVFVTWTAGIPTLSHNLGSGTLFPPQQCANGWWRVSFAADSVVAANANIVYIYPNGTSGFGSVYAWGVHAEDSPVATSYMKTQGAVASRPAETLGFSGAPSPGRVAIYAEFIEGGTSRFASQPNLWRIGAASGATPMLACYQPSPGTPYSLYFADGIGVATLQLGSGAPSIGDFVRHGYFIDANILWIFQSINGAPVVSANFVHGLTLPAAWSESLLWLNGISSTQGASRWSEWRALKLDDVPGSSGQEVLDNMRRFELGPNGALLPAGV